MELYAPAEINGAKLIGVFESGTSAWHEARADGLGGSEIGTIMGLNPYESAFTLYQKKVGAIPQPVLDSFAVWRGNAYEQPLLDYFAGLHPELDVYKTGTYQHPKLPFLHANPDAIAINRNTGEMFIVEVKTARSYWDEVPPHYIAQIQHYMDTLGIDNAYLIGDVGSTWFEMVIPFDKFEADNQQLVARGFWKRIQDMEAPDWDGSQSTYETVRQLAPATEENEVEIDGGHSLVLAQEAFEKAQEELNQAKSTVMSLMGNAKHAYIEYEGKQYRIASKQQRKDGLPYLVVKKGK